MDKKKCTYYWRLQSQKFLIITNQLWMACAENLRKVNLYLWLLMVFCNAPIFGAGVFAVRRRTSNTIVFVTTTCSIKLQNVLETNF